MKFAEKELKKKFSNIYLNEKLAKYSWFNLGGPAEIFFRPKDKKELSAFLIYIKDKISNINIMGAGSNTLVRDGGVKGATIKLGSNFSYVKIHQNNIIEAGAATLDKKVADFAAQNSFSGLEFLACIPGSIGGAIRMNSGCYGNEISKSLVSFKAIDFKGNLKEVSKNEINFFYRNTNLPENLIILSAKFKTTNGIKNDIEKKQSQLVELKKKDQPNRIKTLGSTFKNPLNKKAWQLIKDSNCTNFTVGKAKISDKHCNFLINEGGVQSLEVEELIKKIQAQVLKKTGEKLELEIKIIGD